MLQSLSFFHLGILVVSLIVMALVIWAVVVSIQDPTATTAEKVVWVIGLLAFPLVGLIVWAAIQVARHRKRPLIA